MKTKGKDFIYFRTPEECKDLDGIIFEKGNGAANLEDSSMPRDFDFVYNNIVVPAMGRGEIGDGSGDSFDDRKIRYDDSRIEDNKLIISVGPTWYIAHKADINRDKFGNAALIERGRENFDEPYAYFARSLGVCFVPITPQGNTFVGARKGEDVAGKLNGIAGHMDFYGDVSKINAQESVFKELDEYGLTEKNVKDMKIAGIAANPLSADGDIVFFGEVDKDDDYFISGEWKKYVKGKIEHEDLIRIKPHQVKILLEWGFIPGDIQTSYEIMYSTRLGLEALAMRMQKDD